MTDSNTIYTARLHGVLFFWPGFLFCLALFISFRFQHLNLLAAPMSIIAVGWGIMVWVSYHFSYLAIKSTHIILCSGLIVRQTINIPLNKIESIDIRQSILGTVFSYGTIMITGTGGSRQFIHYLSKPLTCRRFIEQAMHG